MKNIYLTGDTHGSIERVSNFTNRFDTTKEDDLFIILGDAGYNYYVKRLIGVDKYQPDGNLAIHKRLSRLPITIAVVQGNHEAPAWTCEGFDEVDFMNGKAYQHPSATNVFYLKNGEIYKMNGKTFLVMGGAYSIDKDRRSVPYEGMLRGCNWFPEEQMTKEEFAKARDNLKKHGNRVDFVLTHTCPMSKRPLDMFLQGISLEPDNTMEEEFEVMMNEFSFDHWCFGHYHTDRMIDEKFKILYMGIERVE